MLDDALFFPNESRNRRLFQPLPSCTVFLIAYYGRNVLYSLLKTEPVTWTRQAWSRLCHQSSVTSLQIAHGRGRGSLIAENGAVPYRYWYTIVYQYTYQYLGHRNGNMVDVESCFVLQKCANFVFATDQFLTMHRAPSFFHQNALPKHSLLS